MLTIIEQYYVDEQVGFAPEYAVTLKNGKNLVLRTAQDLFALDNSIKNPIQALSIGAQAPEDSTDETRTNLDFDSDRRVNISLVVVSPNTKWATELFAELEEQIDRTITNSWITRLKSLRFELVVSVLMMLVLSLILPMALRNRNPVSSSEAVELRSILGSAKSDSERLTALVTVKMRELQHQSSDGSSVDWSALVSVRAAFIALPILLLIGTLTYMVAACYPWAVFSWGDYEQHFVSLVARRRTLWTVIVASLVLGILTNLFVVSLPSLH